MSNYLKSNLNATTSENSCRRSRSTYLRTRLCLDRDGRRRDQQAIQGKARALCLNEGKVDVQTRIRTRGHRSRSLAQFSQTLFHHPPSTSVSEESRGL